MVLCTTVLAKEEQRIAQLRDAVKQLEGVMAEKNSPPADQPKLQRKLDGLKQELGKRPQIQLAYNTLAVQALTTTPNQPSAILGGDGNQMLFMARPGG